MQRRFSLLFALVIALGAAGCGSSNRLAEYDYSDHTLAVVASVPPRPEIFTGGYLHIEPERPLATIARAGSIVAKELSAGRARTRLDSAMTHVDVSARMAARALDQSGRYLRTRPTHDERSADYLLDVFIHEYGIDAESWQSNAYFMIKADVALLDGATGKEIWKTRVKARDVITPTYFPGSIVENVLTADALARLSVDEMVVALEHLADYAADQVTHRLRHDLSEARR